MHARSNNLALIFVHSRLQVTTQTKRKKGLQCISECELELQLYSLLLLQDNQSSQSATACVNLTSILQRWLESQDHPV